MVWQYLGLLDFDGQINTFLNTCKYFFALLSHIRNNSLANSIWLVSTEAYTLKENRWLTIVIKLIREAVGNSYLFRIVVSVPSYCIVPTEQRLPWLLVSHIAWHTVHFPSTLVDGMTHSWSCVPLQRVTSRICCTDMTNTHYFQMIEYLKTLT